MVRCQGVENGKCSECASGKHPVERVAKKPPSFELADCRISMGLFEN